MLCVICKKGEIKPARVQAEVKVGHDHLLVPVKAEVCVECGETYYSAEATRRLENVREDFRRKAISPATVGHVYQM